MGRRRDTYTVSHSYAADPDQRKVDAALELWAGGLAESIMATNLKGDTPLVRLHFGPANRSKARRSSRRSGAQGEG